MINSQISCGAYACFRSRKRGSIAVFSHPVAKVDIDWSQVATSYLNQFCSSSSTFDEKFSVALLYSTNPHKTLSAFSSGSHWPPLGDYLGHSINTLHPCDTSLYHVVIQLRKEIEKDKVYWGDSLWTVDSSICGLVQRSWSVLAPFCSSWSPVLIPTLVWSLWSTSKQTGEWLVPSRTVCVYSMTEIVYVWASHLRVGDSKDVWSECVFETGLESTIRVALLCLISTRTCPGQRWHVCYLCSLVM